MHMIIRHERQARQGFITTIGYSRVSVCLSPYNWRLRSKIYQRYGELKHLETTIFSIGEKMTRDQYINHLNQLDLIENRVNTMKMPQNFSEYLYSLKGHIQFVRDRLEKILKAGEKV